MSKANNNSVTLESQVWYDRYTHITLYTIHIVQSIDKKVHFVHVCILPRRCHWVL